MHEYFRAVAIDYDGTLADEADAPSEAVLEVIAELRARGRKVVLVTGRILEELRAVFPDVDSCFDAIVAENGAVASIEGAARLLAAPVEFELDEALVERAVPFRRGQVLLATHGAHEAAAREEIRRLGLECQVTRNRGELMLLPPGISKGSGVYQILGDLRISHHNAIGIGDGENDHSLLHACEIGVAVENAVVGLKRHADLVLEEPGGEGLAAFLRAAVLRGGVPIPTRRWRLELGRDRNGARTSLPGSRVNLLVTGRSKSGKSFLAGLIAEQLIGLGYCLCIIDPEGDYASLESLRGVLRLGGRDALPAPGRIVRLHEHRFGSLLIDLSLMNPDDQRGYVAELFQRLEYSRAATGLPHWILCDEAQDFEVTPLINSSSTKGYCLVTYRPDTLDATSRNQFDWVLALTGGKRLEGAETGPDPADLLKREFGLEPGAWDEHAARGDALLIQPGAPTPVRAFELIWRQRPHVRHWHKYVRGHLPSGLCFVLRTPAGEARGVAANVRDLHRTLRSVEGDVLHHHAGRRDFSRWFGEALQDAELARSVRGLEEQLVDSPHAEDETAAFRAGLLRTIELRYIE